MLIHLLTIDRTMHNFPWYKDMGAMMSRSPSFNSTAIANSQSPAKTSILGKGKVYIRQLCLYLLYLIVTQTKAPSPSNNGEEDDEDDEDEDDGGASGGVSGRVNEVNLNEVRAVREERIERRNVFDEESMDVSMVRYGKKEYVLLFLPLCFLFALLPNSLLT